MGLILWFVIGCVIGWFWMALLQTHKQRAVCDDWWEYAALFCANLLVTARWFYDGGRTLVSVVSAFVLAVVKRLRVSYKRLQQRMNEKEAGQ